MQMKFWKMNGAGNDFILINNIDEQIPQEKLPQIARTLCERHLSLGADGMMVVERPEAGMDADIRMLFYNSDGSLGEMCGNGARCICRYCYENGLGRDAAHPELQSIQATAGIVTGQRISQRLYRIRLNDPSLIELKKILKLDPQGIPALAAAADRLPAGSIPETLSVECGYVLLGDPGIPHITVEYKDDVARICAKSPAAGASAPDGNGASEPGGNSASSDSQPHLKDADENVLRELGRALRFHPDLPKGANVNFYEILGKDLVFERTFERGVEDFTYACGTGTGSLAAVLTLEQRASGNQIRFQMTGGELIVDILTNPDVQIYLTGPTNIVAKGEITDEDLSV